MCLCDDVFMFCWIWFFLFFFFFFQAEDGIRDGHVTGVQTCALPILCLGSAARRDIARDEYSNDREQRRPEIVSPFPCHQKVISVEQAADSNRNVRYSPGH